MPLAGCLISIIDDDESMLEALGGLLRLLGFEVETYGSGEAFIQSGFCRSPSCIVTDIHMPGINGIDLKRWLDDRACSTPVIMITARSDPRLHERALASGAVCLLRKPFDAEALMSCLKRAQVA
jgi:FixJ family two-component response regulator